MKRLRLFAVTVGIFVSQRSSGQARVVSAPSEPSLLNLTTAWARASTLGDLREPKVSSDFLELRVWHGYGPSETQSTILRRTQGHWSAFLARVIRCELQIPGSVGDTASAATMRQFVAEARRRCGASVVDVPPGARLIAADTLVVQRLVVPEATIEAAWNDAERAGVLQLPGRVKRNSTRDEGLTYFVELRRGDEYRAAEMEDLERPEVKADSMVKQVYVAVQSVRP